MYSFQLRLLTYDDVLDSVVFNDVNVAFDNIENLAYPTFVTQQYHWTNRVVKDFFSHI